MNEQQVALLQEIMFQVGEAIRILATKNEPTKLVFNDSVIEIRNPTQEEIKEFGLTGAEVPRGTNANDNHSH